MSHVRKPKLIEQRLLQYASYVVDNCATAYGSWRSCFSQQADKNQAQATDTNRNADAAYNTNNTHSTSNENSESNAKSQVNSEMTITPRLHVDLGCGKGLWTTRAAIANPDALFVGVDMERMCVSFAAECAGKNNLHNTLFTLNTANNIEQVFAEGEIDVLHANFPTPFPRLKEAPKRVTDARQLMAYRRLLGEDGLFCLKTDSQFMFDFTLDQLAAAGYTLLWHTRNLHEEYANHVFAHTGSISQALELHANTTERSTATSCNSQSILDRTALNKLAAAGPLPTDFIESAYERKLIAKGAHVHVLHAIPGPTPHTWEPADYISLFDYLPEDLEQIEYMPLGMEDAITNMRNRQRNALAKAARKQLAYNSAKSLPTKESQDK